MNFNKIQVIKMLRDNDPKLGLKGAKDIVDRYELKMFEDKVARVMGEEIRQELRSWAVVFVNSRNEAFDAVISAQEAPREDYSVWRENKLASDYREQTYTDYDPYDDYDEGCRCEDCLRYRDAGENCSDEQPCVWCQNDIAAIKEYVEQPVKKASDIWCLDTGIEVLDPDGWDRNNYENSWYEEITREEFIHRAGMSTCKAWPEPLLDEA